MISKDNRILKREMKLDNEADISYLFKLLYLNLMNHLEPS